MADINTTQFGNVSGSPQQKLKPAELGGRVRRALANASPDSNLGSGDTISVTKLPRGAVISEIVVYSDGVSGMDDEDLGDSNDADALMDGLDLSSGAQLRLTDDNGGSNGITLTTDLAKELWEVLGYSKRANAPANIDVLLTTSGASGSGNLTFEFYYVID
jgi:hypothetical protein